MRRRRNTKPGWKNQERGVTLLVVAVVMVAVLAMAALAIDISTLYVTRSEAQRAADAAAVAGAKALVAAGVTGDPNNSSGIWQTACTLATQQAQSVAAQNKIGGVSISVAQTTVTFPNAPSADCSGTSVNFGVNPQVKVSVQRTDLPIFFSRMWSRNLPAVSASATAEAFNPSNSSAATGGQGVPVAVKCVKPWIISNCDPLHATPASASCPAGYGTFFDPTTGAISNPGPNTVGVVGEAITLSNNCPGNLAGCDTSQMLKNPPDPGRYVLASVPAPPDSALPSCSGSSSYEKSIEACNATPFSCVGANNGTVDFTNYTNSDTQNGIECLTHEPGPDSLDMTGFPTSPPVLRTGSSNPLRGSVVQTGDAITTSDSIVTVPVYDGALIPSTGQVNIIGFLQVFIENVTGNGKITIRILNVAGCGSNSGTNPIVGGGISPVPVRLIHQ